MNVDKEWLPRWGWLLLGLFLASMAVNVLNVYVFGPLGLPEEYYVAPIVAAMAPVLIYVGVWYDEDRQHYWERSLAWIVGDLAFVVVGTALGAAFALVLVIDAGLTDIVRDLIAMVVGFVAGWALFYWRNPDVYRTGDGGQ